MSFHSCWLQNLLRSLLTDLNGFCELVIPRCKNVQIDVIINYKPKKKKRFHGFFFNFWQRHVRGKSVNFAGKTHNPWKKQKPVAQCRIFDWQLKHEKYKTRHFSLNGESLECNRSVWKMFLKPCFPCFSCCCCCCIKPSIYNHVTTNTDNSLFFRFSPFYLQPKKTD